MKNFIKKLMMLLTLFAASECLPYQTFVGKAFKKSANLAWLVTKRVVKTGATLAVVAATPPVILAGNVAFNAVLYPDTESAETATAKDLKAFYERFLKCKKMDHIACMHIEGGNTLGRAVDTFTGAILGAVLPTAKELHLKLYPKVTDCPCVKDRSKCEAHNVGDVEGIKIKMSSVQKSWFETIFGKSKP